MSTLVPCNCDGCGRAGACAPDAPAPRGWFWLDILDPDGELVTTIQACSEKCQALRWKRGSRKESAA